MTNKEIEKIELKYLNKFYYFMKFVIKIKKEENGKKTIFK